MTPAQHLQLDQQIAIAAGWAGPLEECPRYSSSLADAWQLVVLLQVNNWRVAINTTCDIHKYDIVIGTHSEDIKAFTFEPLEMGICKAFIFYKYHTTEPPEGADRHEQVKEA